MITFVMINTNGTEVSGLGDGFTLQVSKAGAAFADGAGTKDEIGNGWYSYVLTASETDTVGPLSVLVSGDQAIQQNLEYVVGERSINSVEFTYTVTNSVSGLPIPEVAVWVTIEEAGNTVVWSGSTDTSGIAKDVYGMKPRLDPGTYFFWRKKSGFIFSNPDTEVVSA